MMAVDMETGRVKQPRSGYDVAPDGQRFLMLKPQDTVRSTAAITVVQEWASELARLVTPRK